MTTAARIMQKRNSTQSGFTLIEVLVAVLVLLLGLLGMAGVQVRATQAEYESYQRKQAMLLLQDIVDRIQANRKVAACYAITAAGTGSPFAGTDSSGASATAGLAACTAGSLTQQAVANTDLAAWSDALFGAAESLGTTSVGSIRGARGCVVSNGADVYTVSVAWLGLAPTSAPPAALNCGTGLYGDEALRRVVSTTLRVATLN
jgi:type IV pilus assembly protein PilV